MAKQKLTPLPKPSKAKPAPVDRAKIKGATPASADPDLSRIVPGLRHLAKPIGELQFHPRNPRKHSEKNIAAIRASLRQNGQYRPAIASTRTGQLIVIVGNGMLAAALAEDWTHLAVEQMALTEAKENQLAITDNETAALAEWDQEILAAVMRDVDTGNDADLDRMLSELATAESVIPKDQSPKTPATRSFGVIVDCTDAEHQSAVLTKLLSEGYACKAK